MKDIIEMEFVRDGVCLFCMTEACESWSSHGRTFDGYYCNCSGKKKYLDALKPAEENLRKLKQKEEKEGLMLERARLERRLKEIG